MLRYKRLDGVATSLQAALGILLDEDDGQAINTAVRLRALDGQGIPVRVLSGRQGRHPRDPRGRLTPGRRPGDHRGAGHRSHVHMEAPHRVLEVIEAPDF